MTHGNSPDELQVLTLQELKAIVGMAKYNTKPVKDQGSG